MRSTCCELRSTQPSCSTGRLAPPVSSTLVGCQGMNFVVSGPKKKQFPAGSACKPCWELKYCPYGSLVEHSPLPPPQGKVDISAVRDAYQQALAEAMGPLESEDQVWDVLDRVMYLHPDQWELLQVYDATPYPAMSSVTSALYSWLKAARQRPRRGAGLVSTFHGR